MLRSPNAHHYGDTDFMRCCLSYHRHFRDNKTKSNRKEKITMVEFGEQLRKAREAKGMTQQTLAEHLYVTRQAVSRWECGASRS